MPRVLPGANMRRCPINDDSPRPRHRAHLLHRWVFLALLSAGGCGSEFVPVSGRVTQGGKPVSGAVVTFQPGGKRGAPPPSATGSIGHTDEDGRYTLRVIAPDKPGAIAGEHSVTISVPKTDGKTGASKAAPAKTKTLSKEWQDGSKRFTVPKDGTDAANFELESR